VDPRRRGAHLGSVIAHGGRGSEGGGEEDHEEDGGWRMEESKKRRDREKEKEQRENEAAPRRTENPVFTDTTKTYQEKGKSGGFLFSSGSSLVARVCLCVF
jgi:hypothetical protein